MCECVCVCVCVCACVRVCAREHVCLCEYGSGARIYSCLIVYERVFECVY